mgnify:CR=1 FL=1
MPHTEFQTAVERLQALPDEAKADLGPKLNRYLNKLDDLRNALKSGLESGPTKPASDVFDRLEAKYQDMAGGAGQ